MKQEQYLLCRCLRKPKDLINGHPAGCQDFLYKISSDEKTPDPTHQKYILRCPRCFGEVEKIDIIQIQEWT